jgi:hypothetical protein
MTNESSRETGGVEKQVSALHSALTQLLRAFALVRAGRFY